VKVGTRGRIPLPEATLVGAAENDAQGAPYIKPRCDAGATNKYLWDQPLLSLRLSPKLEGAGVTGFQPVRTAEDVHPVSACELFVNNNYLQLPQDRNRKRAGARGRNLFQALINKWGFDSHIQGILRLGR
jgi:hypothetical protein